MYKALGVTLQHCKEKIVLTENLIEITEKMLRNQCVMLLTRKEQAGASREMEPVTFVSLRMGATLIRVSTDHLGEQSSAEAFVERYLRQPTAVWTGNAEQSSRRRVGWQAALLCGTLRALQDILQPSV